MIGLERAVIGGALWRRSRLDQFDPAIEWVRRAHRKETDTMSNFWRVGDVPDALLALAKGRSPEKAECLLRVKTVRSQFKIQRP
ncbi:MAG: hypothetical protein V3R90_15375 [Limibaculum sp.]